MDKPLVYFRDNRLPPRLAILMSCCMTRSRLGRLDHCNQVMDEGEKREVYFRAEKFAKAC